MALPLPFLRGQDAGGDDKCPSAEDCVLGSGSCEITTGHLLRQGGTSASNAGDEGQAACMGSEALTPLSSNARLMSRMLTTPIRV